MKTFVYKPQGVCSKEYTFEMEGNIIRDVTIVGGCRGNLLGISQIMKNKTCEEVIQSFEGVACGERPTSCPDQISLALKSYLQAESL